MRFGLGRETDITLDLKEFLTAAGLAVALIGGLALFKALLMMI